MKYKTALTAGLLPVSLNNYPSHVAAVIFFTGCNYFCPYCQNPLLAQGKVPEDFISLEEIFAYLTQNKKNLDGVVLTGGEPTMLKELGMIIAIIHELGLEVKLDTNGSNPHVIKTLESGNNSPDYYALDIKTSREYYKKLTAISHSYERVLETLCILRSYAKPYEVRITCAPDFVTREHFQEILSDLDAHDMLVLQRYRPFSTLDTVWAENNPPYDDAYLEALLQIAQEKIQQVSLR